jgi:hypothetical protein
MHRLPPVLLASLLLACGDSEGGTASSSSEASTGSSSSAGSDTAATTGDPSAPTTGDESSTTVTSDDSTGAGTTGAPAWCNGWESADGEPYLSLNGLDAAPLVDGGQIKLECGGQGLFMFGLYPHFGGFTPPGDQISFDVVVDVAGHNTNPEGHFYSATDSGYYVGCEPIIGGVLGVVPVIPPDNEDLPTLDGLSADLHVVLHTPNGDVTVDLKLTLVAVDDGNWQFCGQG